MEDAGVKVLLEPVPLKKPDYVIRSSAINPSMKGYRLFTHLSKCTSGVIFLLNIQKDSRRWQ